ncbi:Phosphotransferase [Aphelenchoides bicaudatus]|nr:Phosphotransferase [Aphelenchoides bicaudatus]
MLVQQADVIRPKMKELERFDSCSQYAVDLLTDAFEKASIKEQTDVTSISTKCMAADVYRVRLNKSGYSSSVIAKLPNNKYIEHNYTCFNKLNNQFNEKDLEQRIERNTKCVFELHNREILVYRYSTLNFKEGIKIPQFYFGDFAQENSEKQEILLIEDFTDLCEQNDNLTLNVRQVEQVIDELCKLQVETSQDADLEKTFPLLNSQIEAMSRCILMSVSLFSRRRLPWFTHNMLRKIQANALLPNLESLILTTGTDIKVLCHNDLEPRNLLWQKGSEGLHLLSIIDWQSAHAGNLVTDLATLLSVNLDADERKNSEMELLRRFVQKWNQASSRKLSLAEIEIMYREALKYGMLKLLIVLVTNPEADEINEQFPNGRLTTRLKGLIEDVFG